MHASRAWCVEHEPRGNDHEEVLGPDRVRQRDGVCGAISEYNDLANVRGPRNYMNLLLERARMEGFIVTDFATRFPEGMAALARWAASGALKNRVDVVEGLENAPSALRGLFTGDNLGKRLVRVSE